MPSPPDRPGPPGFIGVGSAGGWWQQALFAHPQIEPPRGAERALHFFDAFSTRDFGDADAARYHAHFRQREGAIAGEWTSRYLYDAWAPALMRRAAPEARIIVLLNDPVEHFRRVLGERLADGPEEDRPLYLVDIADRRAYASHLTRLRRFYDPERILVLQYEQCRHDPLGQYRRTLRFLGVRDDFAPRRLRRRAAGKPESALVGAGLRLGLPEGTRRRVLERLGRPLPAGPAELWPDLEASLRATFDPEVRALRELVPDLDLSLWPSFADLEPLSASPG
jgi:hypothetical protein